MTDYEMLLEQVKLFSQEEPYYVSLLSGVSALIYDAVDNLNWAGFYLMKDGQLTVGPYQGKPACIHIEIGKGVCGTAVQENKTQRVPDVHQFKGHIACDSASNSEIVIPVHNRQGNIIGVLDIDSPVLDRFTSRDEDGLTEVVRIIEEYAADLPKE